MDNSNNTRTPMIILLLLTFWTCAMGDPRTTVAGQFCNNTRAVSGAILADNFVPAMDNLSTQVNANGFGTTVVGKGPNAVYALGQCLEDLGSIDCKLCFSEIRSQLPKCYPNTGGRLFLDGCFGRYEDYPFFDEVIDSKDTKICSYNRNSSNPHGFHEVLREAVGNVSLEARTNRGFAVGSVSNFNSVVFALAQCWKNLDKEQCSSCLKAAATSILSCSPATEGRALYAGCYIRYSTGLFWNINQETSCSNGKSTFMWIILGVSLGGILLAIGVIVVWKKGGFQCNGKGNSLRDLYGPDLPAAISQSNLSFRYEELKKATKYFSASNKLGQGSYGTVYKAVLSDGKEVAVKRLFLNTREWVDQFFNEVNLINQVRHKNLVRLLGCSVDGPESMLLYEYYNNRSLDIFIFGENQKHLDWQLRFDIIRGVAEGLSYLHEESETRIIHRDIKASNILLDEKFKPKITDFGLARSFSPDQTHLTTGIAGTLGYLAPEYIVHGHLTEKADVYSFGILVFEVVTGKRCSNPLGSQAGHSLLAQMWSCHRAGTVAQIIDERIRKENVKEEIIRAVDIGMLCTQANPRSRPAMSKVVEMLRGKRGNVVIALTDPPFLDVSLDCMP